ncbi:MAG TPA: glycosyl hydrolase [Bacteroidales bacterium]|nr:glycosyl hydrolase [Bacteroidales bacterium]
MRRTILLLILTVLIQTVSGQKMPVPSDKKATKETIALFQSMYRLKARGVMYGHQDDLMYGSTWWYEKDRSDTKDFTGDYPAVAGFELGHLELGNERSLDSVSFEEIKEQIRAHYKRGGIITISWHPDNPLTMHEQAAGRRQHGTAWDVSSKEVVASILPGGQYHDQFNEWLGRLAAFFLDLKDDKGKYIPVIFRPFHEHSGSFFWWGTNICTDDQYAALWRYTVDFMRDKSKIHHILYAYNTDRVTSLEQYMKGYPGNDVIDMLSIDMYDRGPQFNQELDNALAFVTAEAERRQKLTALSETGARRGMENWWSSVLLPIITKYPTGYVLTWRHAFIPGLVKSGKTVQPFPADFINFYNSPKTLFLRDLRDENIYGKR